jgi:uncharacterized protein (DUF885 family)
MAGRLIAVFAFLGYCAIAAGLAPQPLAAQAPDGRVRELADAYVTGLFEQFPELNTSYGIPNARHDRLTNNALDALGAWQRREDAWLADVVRIDPEAIADPGLRATYAILRESLESSVAARVCRSELWNVSQMTGWQVQYGFLVTVQPIGSDEARREALARWSALPQYLDTEIANLREGLKRGYSAPKLNVRIVIGQMQSLTSGPIAESPFASPSVRDKTPAFTKEFDALVADRLNPAIDRYREFLEKEYLPAAREAIGVTSLPGGAACYDAAVRSHSSLAIPARQIHALGIEQNAAIGAEMVAIGRRLFKTDDVPEILRRARTDPAHMFKDREALIAYSQAALARAKTAAPQWFGMMPKADVAIEPYPRFREQNAPGEYNAPAEDGSRPGIFFINAYQPERHSRATDESTAFHETIPGHHFQIAIAQELKGIHPLGKYVYNSGYVEGWALYAERLADEMKLYSSDLDRLGMLSSQALRASRLVVDSGLHTMGWTRQQAIDYMLAHTAEGEHEVASEVDRYIIYPGQATAYMLGNITIRRARDEAQRAMGASFDVKAFHDRVLEDGGVPLSFLTAKIRSWAAK